MPMKTVASLIVIVALGTMGYFQIVERINIADTKIKIMEQPQKMVETLEMQYIKVVQTRPIMLVEDCMNFTLMIWTIQQIDYF